MKTIHVTITAAGLEVARDKPSKVHSLLSAGRRMTTKIPDDIWLAIKDSELDDIANSAWLHGQSGLPRNLLIQRLRKDIPDNIRGMLTKERNLDSFIEFCWKLGGGKD